LGIILKIKKMKENIVKWIEDYVSNNNGITSLVVGVSGGIDSALTSTLCAETGLPTFIVSMPIHQNRDQLARAHKHMYWLTCKYPNVQTVEKDLTLLFESFKRLFDEKNELALANSRARLRMTTLYQIAQTNNGIVVGTGNKIEDFGVGFFTKYGDGGVDISPIADLMKSEVRELSKDLGVTEEIVNAPPTDGLWGDDRTDEDQLGATYKELEWAMNYINSRDYKGTVNLTNREEEVLKIYKENNKKNNHKMNPIPVYYQPKKIY
jgi:NAD+ synthase